MDHIYQYPIYQPTVHGNKWISFKPAHTNTIHVNEKKSRIAAD